MNSRLCSFVIGLLFIISIIGMLTGASLRSYATAPPVVQTGVNSPNTCSLASTVIAGDTIIVFVGGVNQGTVGATDSLSQTYTLSGHTNTPSSFFSGTIGESVLIFTNTVGHSGGVVITVTNQGLYGLVLCIEVSGAWNILTSNTCAMLEGTGTNSMNCGGDFTGITGATTSSTSCNAMWSLIGSGSNVIPNQDFNCTAHDTESRVDENVVGTGVPPYAFKWTTLSAMESIGIGLGITLGVAPPPTTSVTTPSGGITYTTVTTSTVLQGINASLTPDSTNTTLLTGSQTASTSIVQSNFTSSTGSTVTSQHTEYKSSTRVGNFLVVVGECISTTGKFTITDTLSNVWTLQDSANGGTGNATVVIWTTVTVGGSDTVTVTSGSACDMSTFVYEVKGVSTSSITISSGAGSSSPMTVTSFAQNVVTIGGYTTDQSGAGSWTPATGFTLGGTTSTTIGENAESALNPTSPNTVSTSYSTNSGKTWEGAFISLVSSNYGTSTGEGFNMTCAPNKSVVVSGQNVCFATYLYMNIYPIYNLGVADTVTFFINNTGLYPTNTKTSAVQLDVLVWIGDSLQNLEQFTPNWFQYNVSGFQSAEHSAQVTMLINTRNPCGGYNGIENSGGFSQQCKQQSGYPPGGEYSPGIDASIQPGYNWSLSTPSPTRLPEAGTAPGAGAQGTIGWVAIGFYVVDSVQSSSTAPTSFEMGVHTNNRLMLTTYQNGNTLRAFYKAYLAGVWDIVTPIQSQLSGYFPNYEFPWSGNVYAPPINWLKVINFTSPMLNFDIGLNFQIFNIPISSTTFTSYFTTSPTQQIQSCNGQNCTINNGLYLWLENDLPAIALLIILPMIAFALTFGSLEMIMMGLGLGVLFAQMAGYVPFWVIIVLITVIAFQLVRQIAGSLIGSFSSGGGRT